MYSSNLLRYRMGMVKASQRDASLLTCRVRLVLGLFVAVAVLFGCPCCCWADGGGGGGLRLSSSFFSSVDFSPFPLPGGLSKVEDGSREVLMSFVTPLPLPVPVPLASSSSRSARRG